MNAYTYLIGWSKHEKFYYGAQWNKNSTPDDLWTKYFTSSNRVKRFREKYGEPDIVQIRKTFGENWTKCRNWEERVLIRLKPNKNAYWLNTRVYNKGWFSPTGSVVAKNLKTGKVSRVTRDEFIIDSNLVGQTIGMVSAVNKITGENVYVTRSEFFTNNDIEARSLGRVVTPEQRKKLSEIMTGKVFAKDKCGNIFHVSKQEFHSCDALVSANSGYTQTEETRRKIGESKIGKPRPQSVKDAVRKSTTGMVAALNISTGIISRVSKQEFEINPNLVGATYGRIMSDNEKTTRSASMKGVSKGLVTCRDIRTGKSRKVSRETFETEPYLVGTRSRVPNLC